MRIKAFATRNLKELLRDPLNVIFALGFPLVIMILLYTINRSIPEAIFPLTTLTPGLCVFGLSFIALFSGTLISKDRTTSFLTRLFASPLKASDFIIAYTMPLFPLCVGQSIICIAAAALLGLPLNGRVFIMLLTLIPSMILFIAIGLLVGTILNDKQVGGICGALLTNLSAWLSGTWFDLKLIGGWFETLAYMLPFAHATDAGKAALAGNYAQIMPHLSWVIGYALAMLLLAIYVFQSKMRSTSPASN